MFTKFARWYNMNKRDCDILLSLAETPYDTQRRLADCCGCSLGAVNSSLKALQEEGYLSGACTLTEKARLCLEENRPRRAVILAAGFGMRMVPINTETPKGLLEVHGEPLIERLIRQLHEVGIREIYVVVGFMKERYEYLIDAFGVRLIVNKTYSTKNNLHSLLLAADVLDNAYIAPCDIWCRENPFRAGELLSWYMVSDGTDAGSGVKVNRKQELVVTGERGSKMIGICYLTAANAAVLRSRMQTMAQNPRYDGSFWEEALYENGRMTVFARVVPADAAVEINTYEQLRELDASSNHLRSDAIAAIAKALDAREGEIEDITVLKKGMTNRSFLFHCRGKKYIMRIPGEGTDKLINRREEAAVYAVLAGKGICDNVAYIDPANGYKITEFLEGARVCDPENPEDVGRCMEKLRQFHESSLSVSHEFDIFGQIEYYETLRNGTPSEYRDYAATKAKVLSLRPFIDAHIDRRCLTHIDAVPDNFLFVPDGHGGEDIRLIDWEYAGMQDPHVDIAMFCVYAMYDRAHVEALIDAYFPDGCPSATRVKIYCYIAACGLLWSNWCEYKRILGVEFGEYSLRQYRFAKEYYKIAREAMEKTEESGEQ